MSTRLSINVLPAHRRVKAAQRARARLWCATCVLSACGLAFSVGVYRFTEGAVPPPTRGSDPAELARRIEEANTALRTVRVQLQSAQAQASAAEAIEDHPDWSALLALLGSMRGESIQLRSVEIQQEVPPDAKPAAKPAAAATPGKPPPPPPRVPERYVVRMAGLAQSTEGATAFVLALEQLSLFKSVRLVETAPRDYFGLPMAGFKIECTLAEREVAPDRVPPAARRGKMGPPSPDLTATVPTDAPHTGSER